MLNLPIGSYIFARTYVTDDWEPVAYFTWNSPAVRFIRDIAAGQFGASREWGDARVGRVELWHVRESAIARLLLFTNEVEWAVDDREIIMLSGEGL